MEEDKPLKKYVAQEPLTRPFLAFEWIGTRKYFDERGWGTRGATATSADFAFRFRNDDGTISMVLGEWKYTEYYTQKLPASPDKLNKTRLATYREHYERWKVDRPNLPDYESFFSEPFYQLMRLTLLARAMARQKLMDGKGELGADHIIVVHVAPAANANFSRSLTSPALKAYGSTVSEIWSALEPHHFVHIAAEDLIQSLSASAPAHLRGWGDYLLRRYGWWTTQQGMLNA